MPHPASTAPRIEVINLSKRRTSVSAHTVFRKRYKGEPNLMTPHIVRYGWAGNLAYEVSTGDGLGRDRAPIWGVTFLNPDGTTPNGNLSQCFACLNDVDAYIEEVRRDH